jgi:hypothetical protein
MTKKVPYTNDGGPPSKSRGSYMRLERREKNILLVKENALSATWTKLESIFDKFMANTTPQRDQELCGRFCELMKQFRKERNSYLKQQVRVNATIDAQMIHVDKKEK